MSMHHLAVCVLLISGFLTGCATTDAVKSTADAETAKCKKHQLKFRVTEECVKQVVKDTDCDCNAEAVIAHACDTVEWRVIGKKKKFVSFDEQDGSPFTWFKMGDSQKIVGEVKSGAARDKPYKYTVSTDGLSCEHDPMIIVGR